MGTGSTKSAKEVLRTVFGYTSFRGEQEAIIEQVAGGGDAFVLMPTGSGKSLCYQVPALLRDGVGVVVSPLIALMQDQVLGLRQLGVRAAYLNSTLSLAEAREVEQAALEGRLDLLYIAPERLFLPRTLEFLDGIKLALFAIDEAHCVSQWGHDFRPEYLRLSALCERYRGVPRIALTATADEATRREILERLGLTAARVFFAGFDRPNLYYAIVVKHGAQRQLEEFLRLQPAGASGIVYCLSRRKVEETAEWLVERGYAALPYHAGLPKEVRAENQARFLRDESGIIIVATIAFGMGIDKPDVRFVAHLDLPSSIEAYYQETGRSGRDGQPANVFLTYGFADVIMQRELIYKEDRDPAALPRTAEEEQALRRHRQVKERKLEALVGYCETTRCRRQVLLTYFGEPEPTPCGFCDNCLHPPTTFDGTQAAQKALSAVYRTGQRFGAAYLIDLLIGHASERIVENGHQLLKTFGVGKELDRTTWRSVLRQLVAAGFLRVDIGGHGSIRLTDRAAAVLRAEVTVALRTDPTEVPGRRDRKRSRRGDAEKSAEKSKPRSRGMSLDGDRRDEISDEMFEALRRKRRELALSAGVPPYVVFHDTTLREMASRRPQSLVELSEISGVGSTKLTRYGDAFLRVLTGAEGEAADADHEGAGAPL